MNWFTKVPWLPLFAGGRRDADFGDSDRAGMGTAFGLEASLGDEPQRLAAAERPAGGETASEPWERRLVRRSSL